MLRTTQTSSMCSGTHEENHSQRTKLAKNMNSQTIFKSIDMLLDFVCLYPRARAQVAVPPLPIFPYEGGNA